MTQNDNPKHRHRHDVCPVWMAYTFDHPIRKLFHRPSMLFGPYLKPGMKALDLGCGLGYFTLGMARMVGAMGKVYAVDMQEGMLKGVERRALRAGVEKQVHTIHCSKDAFTVPEKVDFALAFWMLHETPDPLKTLSMLCESLKPGGYLFLAEPGMHVEKHEFEQMKTLFQEVGLKAVTHPKVRFSRAVILQKRMD